MLQHLPLIWKNSVRNKRRSLLTIASIALSLCLLGFLGAMYEALFTGEATPDQALRLIVRNRISLANPLPLSYRQRLEQVQGVTDVMALQWYGGTYKDPANFFARFAVEPVQFRKIYPEFRMSDSEYEAFVADRTGCIVGRKLATRFGFHGKKGLAFVLYMLNLLAFVTHQILEMGDRLYRSARSADTLEELWNGLRMLMRKGLFETWAGMLTFWLDDSLPTKT